MSFVRNIGSFIVKEHGQFFTKTETNWYPISTQLKCLPGVWRISRGSTYPYPLLFSHKSLDSCIIGEHFKNARLLQKFQSENHVKFSCCQNNTLKTDSVITIFPGLWGLYSHQTNWTKYPGTKYRWFMMDMEAIECEADLMLDKLILK